ncbi:hypothetical protein SUDANB21_02607 [Streptomyces sp. enrichment culture]|jgi:hypothetical protein|uniref:hypothetical protein n=1 Tax=Streptomyces TaxID=1883 RepID=UPI0029AD7D4B|nr:hypothetical protein [Streptomyces sp. MD20-1-1]WSB84769.1 hypothetical protein OHA60_13860 [Streptomyces cellulosae]
MKVLRGCTVVAAVLVLCVIGMFALVRCGANEGGELSSRQVVGVWTGSDGGRVEFRADGRFEMSGIPRSAVVFAFVDPPPGEGKLSGGGEWELADGDRSGTIELGFDAGGSFPDDSQSALLEVKEAGDRPVLYFAVDPDKAYGYEVRRVRPEE